MKQISINKLSKIIKTNREKLNISQKKLCELTGINRAMISKIENGDYLPSIEQLETLGKIFKFEYEDLFEKEEKLDNILEIGLMIFIVKDECLLSEEDIDSKFATEEQQ